MKKRFSEEQIIGFLREANAGMTVKDSCRRHGFSEALYYRWHSKLKKLLAEQMFENDVIKDVLRKKP